MVCGEGSHSFMIASLAVSQLLLFYNQAMCGESLIKIRPDNQFWPNTRKSGNLTGLFPTQINGRISFPERVWD